MLNRFVRPLLDLVFKAVQQFFRYWRGAPWQTQLALSPVLLFALLYLGIYTFLFGCRI